MPREFVLPDLGEGITEAQIIRVLVNSGDRIEQDQSLFEVETDKAAVEIPSPYEGVADIVHVQDGQLVHVGDVLVTFDDDGRTVAPDESKESPAAAPDKVSSVTADEVKSPAPAATPASPAAAAPAPVAAVAATAAAVPGKRVRTVSPAAPAVRRLARGMGIDLDTVTGTGPGGRITREDLEHRASGGGAPAPQVEVEPGPSRPLLEPVALPDGADEKDKWGMVRRVPLNQIRKTIAANMARSAFTAPHVTHVDEADITELDRMRRELNESTGGNPKLTAMSFIIRAICLAMRRFPIFNASFDEEGGCVLYRKYINVGIAVDAERGLIVPVIRNADTLSLTAIAAELRSIAERVRSGRFAVEDLRGGTFTITNVGALGGLYSTPIINPPEVAILGLGRSRNVAVFRGEDLCEALMLPLSLSFDHRVIDGAKAARFTNEIISYLQMPAKFLLA